MINLKIQRIRSCAQCGSILPKRCTRCLAHPNRKPHVRVLYDWPEILATAECGCCVKLQCQLSGCPNTFWRYMRLRSAAAKPIARTLLCSHQCSAAAANLAKHGRAVPVRCGYSACAREFKQIPSKLKGKSHVFCKPECWYLHRSAIAADAAAARRLALKAPTETEDHPIMQWCENGCKAVTEHKKIARTRYACLECNHERTVKLAGIEA